MKAVADASVFIALGRLGRLSLLPQRFPGGILVPEVVWQEVVEQGQGQPGAQEIASVSWVSVRRVKDRSLVSLLGVKLDSGEAEAIALSREEPVAVVLLDEKEGRQVAQRLGLTVWVR